MGAITVDKAKCTLCGTCKDVCPFGAIEITKDGVDIGAACKSCGLCVKNCPEKAMTMFKRKKEDLSAWNGILVYGEYSSANGVHPVTIELIGKAVDLSKKCNQPVYCVLVGDGCGTMADEVLQYPVDKVFVYDDPEFRYFRSDLYANALQDCIDTLKPSVVLIGATPLGRSLAPRVAVRYKTGLTADCTTIDIKPKGELIQIRPAFGGNIMAQIVTPYTRPQFATVRYKVMTPAKKEGGYGTKEIRKLSPEKMASHIKINDVIAKEKKTDICECERLVVAGKGLRSKDDLELLERLAKVLDAEVAGTRPMIEDGWVPANRQIGLSGRTVKPKLIITCGVSGAVQFVAGMKSSDCIIAINSDPDAPIFSVADYAIVGDLYTVIPRLIESFEEAERRRKVV